MRVYFLHDETACGFYRCILPAMYMRLGGMAQTRLLHDDMRALGENPFLTPQFRISAGYRDMQKKAVEEGVDWADVVVLQRMGGRAALELIDTVKRHGKLLVHETDDLCEMVPKWSTAHWYWRKPEVLEVYAKSMEAADLITTTNDRIADYYRKKHRPPVQTLMNMIDYASERWTRNQYVKNRDAPTVGWMGSETHHADMELLREVVPWLLDAYPSVRFEFGGYRPDWAAQLDPKRTAHWLVGTRQVPEKMAHWDIGLAPIVDEPFNTTGKSDIKFIEYSCVFAATLASNLAPYKDHIEPGGTGLLAQWNDPEGWKNQLKRLIERPAWREQMVKNAHDYARKERNAPQAAALWFKAYADALCGKP